MAPEEPSNPYAPPASQLGAPDQEGSGILGRMGFAVLAVFLGMLAVLGVVHVVQDVVALEFGPGMILRVVLIGLLAGGSRAAWRASQSAPAERRRLREATLLRRLKTVYEQRGLADLASGDPGSYSESSTENLLDVYEHMDAVAHAARYQQLLAAIKAKVEVEVEVEVEGEVELNPLGPT